MAVTEYWPPVFRAAQSPSHTQTALRRRRSGREKNGAGGRTLIRAVGRRARFPAGKTETSITVVGDPRRRPGRAERRL